MTPVADSPHLAGSADDFAIRVRGVSKTYSLYDRPLDRLVEFVTGGRKQRHREVRGLAEVSFTVPCGMTLT